MKHLRFMLGFLTGATVVYLTLYRPLKEQRDSFQSVMDEASRRITEFEAQRAQEEAAHPYQRRRPAHYGNGWGDRS